MKTHPPQPETAWSTRAWGCVSVLGVLAATVLPAGAAILHVGNNGADSATCGPAASPCRSITRAIANAAPGNTITVGPGAYGDLDHSGILGDFPGEEIPSGNAMINVNKTLTIQSRDGAGSAVLDAAGLTDNVVTINAPGPVVFGKINRGLTVRRGRVVGVLILSSTVKVRDVVADSNVVNGFEVDPGVTAVTLNGNAAFFNNIGFVDGGTGTVVTNNVARQNGEGFVFSGDGALATKNVASNNAIVGVHIDVPAPGPASPVAAFNHNAIVGNPTQGLRVEVAGPFTQNVALAFDHNNYMGNGDAFLPASNCGLVVFINDSSGAPNNVAVTSTKDFWGAPGGPGVNPRDDAGTTVTGSVCSQALSGTISLTVNSPAAGEFLVPPPMIK